MFSKKDNYKAWDIDINSFPNSGNIGDKIKFILKYGVLAPSAHNTQPWSFFIKNNALNIHINQSRSLKKSDPEGRLLYEAIGCFLENCKIASDYFGLQTSEEYNNISSIENFTVKILFEQKQPTKNEPAHLIRSINKRRTNRNKYFPKLPPVNFLETIEQFSNNLITVKVISNAEQKNKLADIMNSALLEIMDQSYFREELSEYIKSSITKSKTGMPGFSLGIPLPISLIASQLIKKINLSKGSKKQDDELLKKYTPSIVVISSTLDTPEQWLEVGKIFEKIWLMAEQKELSCSPLVSAVQLPQYRKELQQLLGSTNLPQTIFRLGFTVKKTLPTPRFKVDELLVNS